MGTECPAFWCGVCQDLHLAWCLPLVPVVGHHGEEGGAGRALEVVLCYFVYMHMNLQFLQNKKLN